MPSFIGNYSITGLSDLNAWDTLDIDDTTDLTVIPDVTDLVQTAVDNASLGGLGGIIGLPPGLFRINGVEITKGGISIVGAGWETARGSDFSSDFGPDFDTGPLTYARRGTRGTYILNDDPATPSFIINPNANNVIISNMAFIQPQPIETPGWVPLVFGPIIQASGVSGDAGSVTLEKLLFWGVYKAIKLGDSTNGIGSATLRDISYATFAPLAEGGIEINGANTLTVDNVNYLDSLFISSPQVQFWMNNSAAAMRVVNPLRANMANLNFIGSAYALLLSGTYADAVPTIKLANSHFERCQYGIWESGVKVGFSGTGLTFRGDGIHTGTAIFSQGDNGAMDFNGIQMTNYGGSGVSAAGSSADIRFGPQLWIDNWNLAGVAAPALFAVGGNTIRYSTITRFSRANTGANTGGGGTFTTY